LVFLLTATLSGCYRHDFAVSGTMPEPHATHDQWQHHLFNGLINLNDDVDLRAACPQGVSRVENGMSVVNALLYILTVTIYSPTTVEVYCRQTAAVAETVDREPSAVDREPSPVARVQTGYMVDRSDRGHG